MLLCICLEQLVVYNLHIVQHFLFTSFPGAFSEATVIHQHHVIIVAVKITRIFGPSFNASRIAMEIQNQASRIIPVKVQTINADTRFDVKKIFAEWDIIFKLKVPFKLFRFEDEFFLEEIHQQVKDRDAGNNIPEKAGQ